MDRIGRFISCMACGLERKKKKKILYKYYGTSHNTSSLARAYQSLFHTIFNHLSILISMEVRVLWTSVSDKTKFRFYKFVKYLK